MDGLNYIEKKGDITFYSDVDGNLLQQIGVGTPFPIDKEESTQFKHIGSKHGYTVTYCTNGTTGYCIVANSALVAQNLWTLKEADEKLLGLPKLFV